MVSKFALLSNLLLASAALAAPSSRLAARIARRREGRQSQPLNRVESAAGAVSHVEYSSNWAGAVWDEGDVCVILMIYDVPQSHLFLTGNFHRCHWYLHRPHPFGQRCRLCLGWYRR